MFKPSSSKRVNFFTQKFPFTARIRYLSRIRFFPCGGRGGKILRQLFKRTCCKEGSWETASGCHTSRFIAPLQHSPPGQMVPQKLPANGWPLWGTAARPLLSNTGLPARRSWLWGSPSTWPRWSQLESEAAPSQFSARPPLHTRVSDLHHDLKALSTYSCSSSPSSFTGISQSLEFQFDLCLLKD